MTSTTIIAAAVAALHKGELVAFPTETVYGLGADATQDLAVAEVYETKGRPQFNPLISHVSSVETAFALGDFDESSQRLAKAFWPGALTLVVPRLTNCPVSLLASAGLDTIAIRVPSHPVALELLRVFGKPVVAPSANPSGQLSPTTAQHVQAHLGHKVSHIIDGGACEVGVESTVIRVMEDGPYVLRAGGIARDEISKVLGRDVMLPRHFAELHAPGQLASHYAPHANLRLNAVTPEEGETYLGFGAFHHGPWSLSPSGNLLEAAAHLFRLLHEIDALRPSAIAVAPIPQTGLGEAINDRLQRAAAPRGVA